MQRSGDGGRRTQAERRERTEAALLRASAQLVVEGGVRSLTIARAGEQAGYSRGIVTHHYGSRAALLDALARAAQAGFVPGVEHDPGLERLLYLVEGYVAALGHADVMSRAFLVLWAEAATDGALAETFRARDDAFRADLRDDVVAGIAAGTIRADVAAQTVAVAIMGQLRGIAFQRLLDPGAVDIARLRRQLPDHWRRALTS